MAHYRCLLCEEFKPLEVHHLIPVKDGGSDDFDNAVSLCPNCHEIYGDNPSKRKWIKEKRDFWYEKCEKILIHDNLEQLGKVYNIIEKEILKKDEKINNLEQKITILSETIQYYTPLIDSFISKFPYSNDKERLDLATKIGTSSNVVAVSGVVMDNFSRKKYGIFYETASEFGIHADKDELAVNLEEIFDLKKKEKE